VLGELKRRTRDFDLVHDNQCLGHSMVKVEQLIPTVVTLHHPITRDRELEMTHAKSKRKRRQLGRWYRFVEMQGKVARQMPRIVVVSENSIKDIHADMGVSLDRMSATCGSRSSASRAKVTAPTSSTSSVCARTSTSCRV
jgi:hypothetical protein